MEGWKLILDHVTRSLCIDIHYYLHSSCTLWDDNYTAGGRCHN